MRDVSEFWYVGTSDDRQPIPPQDENLHDDQGAMVYQSQRAAEASARHQNEMYELGSPAAAFPLIEMPSTLVRLAPDTTDKEPAHESR